MKRSWIRARLRENPIWMTAMLKRIGLIGLALALLTCAGVAYKHSQGAIIPGLPTRPLAEMLAGPIASGDSMVVADFAEQRCELLPADRERACYEELLLALVNQGEVRLAMNTLGALGERKPAVTARGHEYTHVVGINAWNPDRDLGATYSSCTGLFQSGCYHGVVQSYLAHNGVDSTTVANLCDLIPDLNSNMWLRFQCVHGLGHGLVSLNAQHLPKALHGCDWLFDAWDAESCYGGAFMEFIVAGRGQSHHHAAAQADTAPSADEHAEHGEHAHAATAIPDSFPSRNRADPLYPCSVLETKYQRSCYGMQAGIIYETVGPNWSLIASACDKAPLQMRPACYQGIGTYVSGVTVRDPDKSVTNCMQGNPDYRAWCFVGVVKNFIDVTARPEDGIDFCRRLSDRTLAISCYVAVGEELAVLNRAHDEREAECGRIDPAYVAACRYGALLTPERPPELPNFSPAPGNS
jgi:hypothetical protein